MAPLNPPKMEPSFAAPNTQETDNEKLHEQLRRVIYNGQDLWNLARKAISFGLGVLLLVPFAARQDWGQIRQLRAGRFDRDRDESPASSSIG